MFDAAFVLCGYLAGSLSCAVLVCRLLGYGDPRAQGSGNPGATNVLRLYGKRPALLTLAGDLLKGLLPVLLAREFGAAPWIVALTGAAAFLGHLYPVFFAFQGGKGVATLLGVLFGTHWLLGAGFAVTWLLVAVLFRYSSLSAITAATLTPVYAWLLLPDPAYATCFALLAAALIWRHRGNLQKLRDGTEERIGAPRG
jgi:glycerol-3-phosphate acyltransferase PlsY